MLLFFYYQIIRKQVFIMEIVKNNLTSDGTPLPIPKEKTRCANKLRNLRVEKQVVGTIAKIAAAAISSLAIVGTVAIIALLVTSPIGLAAFNPVTFTAMLIVIALAAAVIGGSFAGLSVVENHYKKKQAAIEKALQTYKDSK